jgi:hypothetical protein
LLATGTGTVISECFCFASGAAGTGTDSPSADATLTAEDNSEDSLLKTPVPVAAASRLQKRRAAQRESASADFSDVTVGETTTPGSGERPSDRTLRAEEQGSKTTFLVEAATPSFLESPEKKTGRAAMKARAKTKATVADFEDITVNGANQEEPDGSASDSYMEKGHQKSGGPATPSFLASPDEPPSRRKQRFPSRVAAAAASDFSDISVAGDASHNKEGRRESAADTSQGEQNKTSTKEATTPSFLASPEKKAGRTARARAIPQAGVSAFDDVTVNEARHETETPQQANPRDSRTDVESNRGCAATPSFLASPDERSRAKSRFQRRVGVATEADFDDISVRDATGQNSPQNGKDQGADASQREQSSNKTSFLEAATPTFLASPAVKAGRAGKGARGKSKTIATGTGVADFDNITLGDAESENRSGGAEETSQREENSVNATLVDVATPSFLASPAEKTTRRQARTKKTGAAVDNLADFTNLDRSLTPKSRETGQDAEAVGSLTPSFLKDSTIQTSVRSARETSTRDDSSSAATPRRNRNEKKDTSPAADSAEENKSKRAEKVSEGPAGVEGEEEGGRGSEKSQKLEETRALRASRKSEVLGYLVRYGTYVPAPATDV